MTAPVPNFPEVLEFRYSWRDYQARVLHELEPHLRDGHLHVVAAPGAGKTILGLEVTRRLARPALVVAPTITIRNQWCERFHEAFDAEGVDLPAMTSTQLDAPGVLTVTTYQALASAADQDSLHRSLASVGTLVLDEAHHLRNVWWKALTDLKAALEDVTVLSLTATPPFDVSASEWNRYISLCGPIDAEISVPELVATGDLCPHQDYVHLSLPTDAERAAVSSHRTDIAALCTELRSSPVLERAVLGHPHFVNFDTDAHREGVLAEPALLCAMVVFAHATGHPCDAQRAFLGVERSPVPTLDEDWLAQLLTELLFGNDIDRFDIEEADRRTLRSQLDALQVIERRRVRFDGGERTLKQLRASATKLASIAAIYEAESEALGDALRLVVLTDHVRREAFRTADPTVRQMGAVPAFETLRETGGAPAMTLLTGSLVMMPRRLTAIFEDTLVTLGVAAPRAVPHPVDLDYVLYTINDSLRQGAVAAATRLFNAGELRVIVGTAALLGEGWDAQAANTLIIASAVSTHMLSNQMRGRVIRTDAECPDKASNIWHLACLEPALPGGGGDFKTLRRRFAAFQGIANGADAIESGFERVQATPPAWSTASAAQFNESSLANARGRGDLAERWRRALGTDQAITKRGLVEELRMQPDTLRSAFHYHRPGRGALVRSAVTAGIGLGAGWVAVGAAGDVIGAGIGAVIAGVAAAALSLPRALYRVYRAYRLGVHGEVAEAAANALVDALVAQSLIKTSRDGLHVRLVSRDAQFACDLSGASLYESNMFVDALAQLLGPVDNPRYLLARQLGGGDRYCYHAVPDVLGLKATAQDLQEHWRKRMGRCDLVYTRTAEGRRALVRARLQSWDTPDGKPERVSCWR